MSARTSLYTRGKIARFGTIVIDNYLRTLLKSKKTHVRPQKLFDPIAIAAQSWRSKRDGNHLVILLMTPCGKKMMILMIIEEVLSLYELFSLYTISWQLKQIQAIYIFHGLSTTSSPYVSRLLKYQKKCLGHLTTFFMSTWKKCRNLNSHYGFSSYLLNSTAN